MQSYCCPYSLVQIKPKKVGEFDKKSAGQMVSQVYSAAGTISNSLSNPE